MTQITNCSWSADVSNLGWMGQDLIKVFIVKDGIIWDTLYYVPCLGRTYDNCGSARKAISMFNKRGGR